MSTTTPEVTPEVTPQVAPVTELDEFLEWAKPPRGHYGILKRYVDNYRKWKIESTELQREVLQRKVYEHEENE